MEKRLTRSDAKKVDETTLENSPLAKMHPQEFEAYTQYRFQGESFHAFLRRMYGKNRILKEMIPDMPRKRTFLAEDIEILEDLEAMDSIQAAAAPVLIKTEDPEEEEASHPAQDENDFSSPPSPELGEFGQMYNGHQQLSPSAVLSGQAPNVEVQEHKKKRRRKFPLVGMKKYKKAESNPAKKKKTGEEKSEPEDPLGARLLDADGVVAPVPVDPLADAVVPIAVAIPEAAPVAQESKKGRRTTKKKELKPAEPKKKTRKETPRAAKKTAALALVPENDPPQPSHHLIRGLDRMNPNWWIPAMYIQ